MLGLSRECVGASAETLLDAVEPDDRDDVRAAWAQSLASEALVGTVEHSVAGSPSRRVVQRWRHVRGPDGDVTTTIGLVQDVTCRDVVAAELEREHDALRRLHALSTHVLGRDGLSALLDDSLEVAIELSEARWAAICVVDPSHSVLETSVDRLPDALRDVFAPGQRVQGCVAALCEHASRVHVDDVASSALFDEASRAPMVEAGIESLQAIPLSSRDGDTVGLLVLWWTETCTLSAATLRRLDLLAREITDAIVHRRGEEALLETRATLEAFYDSSPLLMGVAELVGDEIRALHGNAAVAAFFGGDPADKTSTELGIDQRISALWRTHYRRARETGASQRFEYEHPTPAGDRWLRSTVTFLGEYAAGRPRFSFVTEDITERKRTELQIEQANARLKLADERKDEFLAMLGHELRNPLSAIITSLYLLDASSVGIEQARRAEGVIVRQVGQMSRLVDDLLDMTRVSREKLSLTPERIELNELVERTVEDHEALFEQRRIDLELIAPAGELFVDADAQRLAQVIGNLLQNAAKFSRPGGRAQVEVDPDVDTVRISVEDNGVGIDEETLACLFEPYHQARREGEHTSNVGLGLGLALARGLVELHGGSIQAHSDGVGKGARFSVELPLVEAVTEEAEAETAEVANGSCRVLIIEDNIDAAESLRDLLEFCNYQVQVAYTGREGVDAARVFRPEVVLSDIGLPGMNGYEVARSLRADPDLANVLLIAVTGYAQPDDIQRAVEAGFNAHIAKPLSLTQLQSTISTIRERGHAFVGVSP